MSKTQINDGRSYRPILLVDRFISGPEVPVDPATTSDGRAYGSAQILVFDDRGPVGQVVVDLPEDGLTADEVRAALEPVRSRLPQTAQDDKSGAPGHLPTTVVIATKRRQDQLARCLAALDRQRCGDFDVIVVDNDTAAPSARGTVESIAVKGRPVRYVHETNPGLANAHNAALPFVETPIVAFTDDDVEPDPGWLKAISEVFIEFPEAACVTGLIYPAYLDHEAQYLVEHLGLGKAFQRRVFDLADNRPASGLFPYAVGACGSGANMAFRIETLREIGGFDGALGAGSPGQGGDDLAAFFDVILAGHTIVYEPAALVRHHHDPDMSRFDRQIRQYGTGLGAYLTRCVVRHPQLIPKMVIRVPAGLRHLAQANGVATESRASVPLAPRMIGMAIGPAAFARGRRALKRSAGR